MLRLTIAAMCLVAMLADAAPVDAGRPRSSRSTTRYPRVYGPTGRPYGPTQAHYQYQRQYGRPWHGYGGINTSYRFATPYGAALYRRNRYCATYGAGLYGAGLYGYGYSRSYLGLGYSGYGIGLYNSVLYGGTYPYSYVSPYAAYQPVVNYSTTVLRRATDPAVFDNAAVRGVIVRRGGQVIQKPREIPVTVKRTGPSALKAKRHSIRLQQEGDEFLHKKDYKRAAARYHSAVLLAPDLAAAHFRFGFAQAAKGELEEAAASFKKGLQIDPRWPSTGENLQEVYGQDNAEATAGIVSKITDWTKVDIRDPDRLFLLGVFLHFANRTKSATLLFTAAQKQGGRADHLTAFLDPIDGKRLDEPKAFEMGVEKPPLPKLPSEQPKLTVPPLPGN